MSILKLKKANCKNCYKCVRQCPVKAIEVRDHQAQIIEESCILCGGCMRCPQNAKEARNDIPRVEALIAQGKKVIASVAPSCFAAFPIGRFADMENALARLGFFAARETAEGAYLVKSRYEALVDAHWNNVIISSCCSTIVRLIQNHYPEAVAHLAPVLSPMQAHARLILEEEPEAAVVFIGPCISKKDECERFPDPPVLAITFEELEEWTAARGICFENSGAEETAYRSRFFPVSGGILNTMRKNPDYRYLAVDGFENCAAVLEELAAGGMENCFIEMSACAGSCVGGPGQRTHSPLRGRFRVEQAAVGNGSGDFDLPEIALGKKIVPHPVARPKPDEAEIRRVLRKMGKHSPEDELNCGTCGYATCREKAAAVCLGKAEISMCLPFMKERAESINDKIIDMVPSGIITVGSDFMVQQINREACRIFGCDAAKAVGAPVSALMDEYGFVQAIAEETGVISRCEHLRDPEKFLEEDIHYDKGSGMVLCVIKDVTEEEQSRRQSLKTRLAAADITDQIIEKQLRIVHEIASLLGETAAETQVALTDLKDAILREGWKK